MVLKQNKAGHKLKIIKSRRWLLTIGHFVLMIILVLIPSKFLKAIFQKKINKLYPDIKDGTFYQSGRSGIAHILDEIKLLTGNRKVLLPEYICNLVPEVIKKSQCNKWCACYICGE